MVMVPFHSNRTLTNTEYGIRNELWGPNPVSFKGKNTSKWPRHCSHDSSPKNLTAFYPCPNKNKKLPEVLLKNLGLMVLARESLRQFSIDSAIWLLVVTFMQINDKEQAEQGKPQNVQFEEKRS